MADEAVRLGPPPASESYLKAELIIDACKATGAEAIFGPGTNLADAADEVLRLLGHNRPPLDEAAE
jgi:acetyl/propionyl-CoA carboxylase alpha subunit